MRIAKRKPNLIALTVACALLVLPSIVSSAAQAKFVVYFYFAPEGCPHCRAMAPEVQRFYQEFVLKSSASAPRREAVVAAGFSRQSQKRGTARNEAPLFDVGMVVIPGWGTSVEEFRKATNVTVPLVADPGLRVDTRSHPVVTVYNRETNVVSVASVGEVSYSTLVKQVMGITSASPGAPPLPPATGAS